MHQLLGGAAAGWQAERAPPDAVHALLHGGLGIQPGRKMGVAAVRQAGRNLRPFRGPRSICMAEIEMDGAALARPEFELAGMDAARMKYEGRPGRPERVEFHSGFDVLRPHIDARPVRLCNDAEAVVALGDICQVVDDRNRVDLVPAFVGTDDVAVPALELAHVMGGFALYKAEFLQGEVGSYQALQQGKHARVLDHRIERLGARQHIGRGDEAVAETREVLRMRADGF